MTPSQSGNAHASARVSVLIFSLAFALVLLSQVRKPHIVRDDGGPGGSRLAQYPDMRVANTAEFRAMTPAEKALLKEREREAAIAATNTTFEASAPREGEPVARLIVLTMDRAPALSRLIASAEAADYGEDRVDLDIWIDRGAKGIDASVLSVVNSAKWTHGAKNVHARRAPGGLYQQWIYTWRVPEQTDELAVILEDDLELSPSFYQWLKIARATYGNDPEVAAFTLQRSTLRPRLGPGGRGHTLNVPKDVPVFKYRLLGSWGFAPQRDAWIEFRKWFKRKRELGERPYVKGLITTQWYKEQEVDGFAPTMWTQWFIRFAHEKGYFTVTPHLEDGTTLCANWRESGMHYANGKQGKDFPLFRGSVDKFTWPVSPVRLDWDGKVLP